MDTETIARASEHRIRVHGRTVVMEWRTADSLAPVEAARAAFDRIEARYGQGVARCLVVLDMTGVRRPPSSAVRRAIVALFRDRSPVATAVVVHGHPFQIKAIQAVVWTLHRLVRGDEPVHTFDDEAEALAWLEGLEAHAA